MHFLEIHQAKPPETSAPITHPAPKGQAFKARHRHPLIFASGIWTIASGHARTIAVPTFAIHCIDKPMQQDLRANTRAEHLAYVAMHIADVVVAGPLLDDHGQPIGSMLIMNMPDRRAAVSFAAEDPYAKVGLFASVAVTAWRQVLPQLDAAGAVTS